jgi:ligand-binding SRPBCC domain-containing protein
MPTFTRTLLINAPIEDVFDFHDDPANLPKITPPWIRMEVLEQRGGGAQPKQVRIRMTQFGVLRQTLLVEFVAHERPHRLVDVQTEGPFSRWYQERTFEWVDGRTRMTDSVDYTVGFGVFGAIVDRLLIRPRIEKMFAYRHARTRAVLEQQAAAVA